MRAHCPFELLLLAGFVAGLLVNAALLAQIMVFGDGKQDGSDNGAGLTTSSTGEQRTPA